MVEILRNDQAGKKYSFKTNLILRSIMDDKFKIKFVVIMIVTFLAGCATNGTNGTSLDPYGSIGPAIHSHKNVSEQIKLGDTKENVLSIIPPTQVTLKPYPHLQKQPEKFIKDGVLVEVYFMRSAHYEDDLTTGDEFTPYVFNDGKLVGVGWTILGGPSTQAQASPVTNVETTIVHKDH